MRNGILQMRHEHQISGLIPIVVNGMVVNVTQNCSSTQTIRCILGINEFAHLAHLLQARQLGFGDLALKKGEDIL